MNLIEIAKIYIDLVEAEEKIPDEEYRAKEEMNALRTKYHELLMDKMREEKIFFCDRFDATSKAFQLASSRQTS